MKLVSDTLLDVFQFLPRNDLEMLCYARKQFRAIVENRLKRVCLRKMLSAYIYFHADLETFEVTAKIHEGNVRTVSCRSVEEAGKHLFLLIASAFVEDVSFLAVTLDESSKNETLYGGYTATDNQITETGIFDFFNGQPSRRWRSGSLNLYCLSNCAEVSSRVIAALRSMEQAPAENITILLSPLSRADVERHAFRLAHTDIDWDFSSSTLMHCYAMDHPRFTVALTYRTGFRSLEIAVNQ